MNASTKLERYDEIVGGIIKKISETLLKAKAKKVTAKKLHSFIENAREKITYDKLKGVIPSLSEKGWTLLKKVTDEIVTTIVVLTTLLASKKNTYMVSVWSSYQEIYEPVSLQTVLTWIQQGESGEITEEYIIKLFLFKYYQYKRKDIHEILYLTHKKTVSVYLVSKKEKTGSFDRLLDITGSVEEAVVFDNLLMKEFHKAKDSQWTNEGTIQWLFKNKCNGFYFTPVVEDILLKQDGFRGSDSIKNINKELEKHLENISRRVGRVQSGETKGDKIIGVNRIFLRKYIHEPGVREDLKDKLREFVENVYITYKKTEESRGFMELNTKESLVGYRDTTSYTKRILQQGAHHISGFLVSKGKRPAKVVERNLIPRKNTSDEVFEWMNTASDGECAVFTFKRSMSSSNIKSLAYNFTVDVLVLDHNLNMSTRGNSAFLRKHYSNSPHKDILGVSHVTPSSMEAPSSISSSKKVQKRQEERRGITVRSNLVPKKEAECPLFDDLTCIHKLKWKEMGIISRKIRHFSGPDEYLSMLKNRLSMMQTRFTKRFVVVLEKTNGRICNSCGAELFIDAYIPNGVNIVGEYAGYYPEMVKKIEDIKKFSTLRDIVLNLDVKLQGWSVYCLFPFYSEPETTSRLLHLESLYYLLHTYKSKNSYGDKSRKGVTEYTNLTVSQWDVVQYSNKYVIRGEDIDKKYDNRLNLLFITLIVSCITRTTQGHIRAMRKDQYSTWSNFKQDRNEYMTKIYIKNPMGERVPLSSVPVLSYILWLFSVHIVRLNIWDTNGVQVPGFYSLINRLRLKKKWPRDVHRIIFESIVECYNFFLNPPIENEMSKQFRNIFRLRFLDWSKEMDVKSLFHSSPSPGGSTDIGETRMLYVNPVPELFDVKRFSKIRHKCPVAELSDPTVLAKKVDLKLASYGGNSLGTDYLVINAKKYPFSKLKHVRGRVVSSAFIQSKNGDNLDYFLVNGVKKHLFSRNSFEYIGDLYSNKLRPSKAKVSLHLSFATRLIALCIPYTKLYWKSKDIRSVENSMNNCFYSIRKKMQNICEKYNRVFASKYQPKQLRILKNKMNNKVSTDPLEVVHLSGEPPLYRGGMFETVKKYNDRVKVARWVLKSMQETKKWCTVVVWNETWEYILQDDIAWYDTGSALHSQDGDFLNPTTSYASSNGKNVNGMSASEYRSYEKENFEEEERRDVSDIERGIQDEYYEQIGADETE